MASSHAATVDQYLAELSDERRALVAAIRDVVNANLPDGYQETMQYGMIGWSVPHDRYPAGYHADPSQPLPFAGARIAEAVRLALPDGHLLRFGRAHRSR